MYRVFCIRNPPPDSLGAKEAFVDEVEKSTPFVYNKIDLAVNEKHKRRTVKSEFN